MPSETFNKNYQFLKRSDLLTFEEILRVVQILSHLGVKKVRLTGGEPLIRHNIEVLIEKISQIEAIEDISLTTNASLLDSAMVEKLKSAGLSRITISLDAFSDPVFKKMNGVNASVDPVLNGIQAALTAGFPVKVNMVVKKDTNLSEVLPMARHFRNTGCILRFIEYMDVGNTNHWRMDEVVPGAELVSMIATEFPIEPIEANYTGEVAKRWRYCDGAGEIGFITSITQTFCHSCSRLRMSANGKLYTCLFATDAYDLRQSLRDGNSDANLTKELQGIWKRRDDRYSEIRSQQTKKLKKVEMSYIGG